VTSTNGDRRAAPGDGFRVVCRFPGADATDLDAPRMTSKEASTSSSPSSQSRSKAYKETGAIRIDRFQIRGIGDAPAPSEEGATTPVALF
jgi:hypothetical protein